MQDTTTIKVGDTVNVVFAWREDEKPNGQKLFHGKSQKHHSQRSRNRLFRV